jgi:hypothetical protein
MWSSYALYPECLSRGDGGGNGFAPKRKWPTRFSRIGHSPAPARIVAGTILAVLPCLVLSAMPYSGTTWENKKSKAKSIFNLSHNTFPVKAWMNTFGQIRIFTPL